MKHRNDHGLVDLNQEVDGIREPVKKTTPYGMPNRRELERGLGNPRDQLEELATKQLTQARTLILIPKYRLFDVGLRLRPNEEGRRHSRRERYCFSFSVISSRASSQGRAAPGSIR